MDSSIAMDSENADLRSRAERRIKEKRAFWASVVGTTGFIAVCWLVWLLSGHPGGWLVPWPAWLSVWWLFLAIRGTRLYSSQAGQAREADVRREMDRMRSR